MASKLNFKGGFSMKKLFAVITSTLLIFSLSSPAFATTIRSSELPDDTIIRYQVVDDSGIVDALLVSGDIPTMGKEAYCATLDDMLSKNTPTTRNSYTISDRDTLQHNNYNLYSEFDSTVEWDLIHSSSVSGNSQAAWLGTTPGTADKITLTDKFTFTGVVLSVSASGPNWSSSMQSATWSASETDKWVMSHIYSNISCVGYDIYLKQVSTGDFKFGGTYYTTSATDSLFL